MRKLIFLGILLSIFSVAFATSGTVPVMNGGSASSTLGVGVPAAVAPKAVKVDKATKTDVKVVKKTGVAKKKF